MRILKHRNWTKTSVREFGRRRASAGAIWRGWPDIKLTVSGYESEAETYLEINEAFRFGWGLVRASSYAWLLWLWQDRREVISGLFGDKRV